jgi:hypothetical protein
MKRTLLAFASLTAIILLSCGSLENLNSPEEDISVKSLNKAALSSASDSYTAATSSSSRSYSGSPASMSVIMYSAGTTANSGEVTFTLPGTLTSTAKLTKVQVKVGALTYNGAVTTNFLRIRKGTSDEAIIYGSVAGNTTITTDYFNGQPAKDTYYVSFNATCVGTGGIANICSKSYNPVNLILYFTYEL